MTDQVQKQYEKYLGSWVRIRTHNGANPTSIGIIKEVTYDFISLEPSLVDETLNDSKLELRLQTKLPTTVSMPIDRIESLTENYVKGLLKRYPITYDHNQIELF